MPTLGSATTSDFKTRYPAFESADDGLVDAVMAEARGSVTSRWIEADQVPALFLLTAHLLSVELYGSGTTKVGDGQVAVTGPIEEIQVGDVKTKFAHKFASEEGSGGGGGAGTLGSTIYGQRYLALLRKSFPPVLVV